jgi:hypothetical protein
MVLEGHYDNFLIVSFIKQVLEVAKLILKIN